MRPMILAITLFQPLLFLYLTYQVSGAGNHGGPSDFNLNPHTNQARRYAREVERSLNLESNFFTDVIGDTHDVTDRLNSHVLNERTRFMVISDPVNQHGILAISPLTFTDPATGWRKAGMVMFGVNPGSRSRIYGEAHFPATMEFADAWRKLRNMEGHFQLNRAQVINHYGADALRFL
ncbi:uncharacterized protein UTRI_06187 [Ustilago trichophora]|uniref:Uncharacterized protein n=1 Tax=Ustilago trichophora TaxID=86804 RepID=A0A5C3EFG8_9BASI|nr:uncharacterized protein UTRI_06187 [Ustilago trichophora]